MAQTLSVNPNSVKPSFKSHPTKNPYNPGQHYAYLPCGIPYILFIHLRCYELWSKLPSCKPKAKAHDTLNQWEFKDPQEPWLSCKYMPPRWPLLSKALHETVKCSHEKSTSLALPMLILPLPTLVDFSIFLQWSLKRILMWPKTYLNPSLIYNFIEISYKVPKTPCLVSTALSHVRFEKGPGRTVTMQWNSYTQITKYVFLL